MAAKKKAAASDPVEVLLSKMREQGLPVQKGGFAVAAAPSGISSFDASTGVGGFPTGRITVISGEEGAGKTLLVLSAIATAQIDGYPCAFVDAERALTPGFAKLLGVEYDDLVISRPRTLNEAYDVMKELSSSGLFRIVCLDSAVAIATEDQIQKSASEEGKRAAEAQVHSSELKKLTAVQSSETAVIITNQLRANPNPPSWWRGGPMLYEPGGRALRFYASLKVKMKTTEVHRDGSKKRYGHKIQTYIEKNKVAQPYRSAEFDITYESGIDAFVDTINTAIFAGIIKKSSSWFYLDIVDLDNGEVLEEVKANGRTAMEEEIKKNPEYLTNIERRLAGRGNPTSDYHDDPEEAKSGGGWEDVQ